MRELSTNAEHVTKRPAAFRVWDKDNNRYLENPDYVMGMDIELEAYTGINDQRGYPIYVGDIIKFEELNDDRTTVVFYGTVRVYRNTDGVYCCAGGFVGELDELYFWDVLTLLGNVHENSELLEELNYDTRY